MEFIFNGLAAGLVMGVVYIVLSILISVGQKGLKIGEKGLGEAKKIVKEVQEKSKSDKQKIIEMDEKKLLTAQTEIDEKKQVKSLWIKAKVLSDGNNEKAEIEYLKLRVRNLEDN